MATLSIPDLIPEIAKLLFGKKAFHLRYPNPGDLIGVRRAILETAVRARGEDYYRKPLQFVRLLVSVMGDLSTLHKLNRGEIDCETIYELVEVLINDHLTAFKPPMGTYRHFKGNRYSLLMDGITDTETNQEMVLYVSLTNGKRFVRRASMFSEVVRWPDGKLRSRWVLEEKLGEADPFREAVPPASKKRVVKKCDAGCAQKVRAGGSTASNKA